MKPESPFYGHCAEVLNKSVLFSGLDKPTLEEMLSIYRRETWPKGAHLPPKQGSNFFTVVISGRLELTRINPDTGRQLTLITLTAGDAFDVITLLDGKEHEIEPVALEPLEVIAAPLIKVRHWIKTQPEFNRAFLPYLGEKIRRLENLSADLALSETMVRLAKLILRQAMPDAPLIDDDDDDVESLLLTNTLTDEEMARMIGSVRVVVNRHIQELTHMGVISTSPGKLIVQDLEHLKEICDQDLPGISI